MIKINKKPLSVNKCWQGRRFKTKEYLLYEKELLLTLPKIKLPPEPYILTLEFGFSNSANDVDNGCKPLIDIFQKRYGFNDKHILELHVYKKIVKKGKEYFAYKIDHYEYVQ